MLASQRLAVVGAAAIVYRTVSRAAARRIASVSTSGFNCGGNQKRHKATSAHPSLEISVPQNKVYDVVIVGGGLVGASLACSIGARRSMGAASIAVLDPAPTAMPAPALEDYSNRCTALIPGSVDFLKSCGVRQNP